MENYDKSTGVDSDDKNKGVKSKSGSTGATDEGNGMALIEEVITEVEWDIVEVIEILSGTEIETDYTQDENMIHPETQVPTEENI